MEEKYVKRKIKKELLKKKFENWDKESIIFLTYVFTNKKYESYHEINLLLLDDYIKWYKKNDINKNNMYDLDKLINLYCLIKEDLLYERSNDYTNFLNNNIKNEKTCCFGDIYYYFLHDNLYSLNLGVIITLIYIILKYLLSFQKPANIEKKVELKIPIPENILNNPLIKHFLSDTFLSDKFLI